MNPDKEISGVDYRKLELQIAQAFATSGVSVETFAKRMEELTTGATSFNSVFGMPNTQKKNVSVEVLY